MQITKEQTRIGRDITHTILSVLFIFLLIALSFWILLPFLVSILWAAVIVIASWPIHVWLQRRLAIGPGLSAVFMTTGLLLTFLVPVMLAVVTIARGARNLSAQIGSFDVVTLPKPPPWLKSVPLAGEKMAGRWETLAMLSPEERSAKIAPFVRAAQRRFVALAGSMGRMVLNFLLTMIFAGVLYARGELFREGVLNFGRRLAGRRGEDVTILAVKAVRGVVLGIVVTALTQAAIGGIGLIICGVPAPALLTAIMLILCLAQLGPLLVLIPSVIWLYYSGQAVWGTILLVFSVIAGTIDNFLRPLLISRGSGLPLLLIILGVIGGLIAFGVIGLFIGPVILAVSYALLKAWVLSDAPAEQAISNSE